MQTAGEKFGNTCPKSPALLLQCRMSAFGGKADIALKSRDVCF
jgi:hypothetical protein